VLIGLQLTLPFFDAFVCSRASESTIIGLILQESATGMVTTFDICSFQGVTALALTTLWKP
jgi:hypothetical protein